MESPVLIDCVIPTHGRPDLLREALVSVIAQTTPPDTVFVVDDLGQDATAAVVHELDAVSAGRVVYVDASEGQPKGASRSRNIGARRGGSDWIAFLDDDDVWEPSHLSGLVSALREGDDLACSHMKIIRRDGTVEEHYGMRPSLRPDDVLARNPGITGSNFMVRRETYSALDGFDEALPVSNDKDFFARFLLSGGVYSVSPAETALHRQHLGEQLTSWNERRAVGLELYIAKFSDLLSRSDRRHLVRQIHSIRARTASSRAARVRHAVQLVALTPPRSLASRALRMLRRPGFRA